MKVNNKQTERRFILIELLKKTLLFIVIIFGLKKYLFKNNPVKKIWQIDPSKCIQCGKCADNCILVQSAVRCVHNYNRCGYCSLCFGYFKPGVKDLKETAANQICPSNAIERKFIEEPFYEYNISKERCIGCSLCVKGCNNFGNGSLYLQVIPELCKNCNICSIAKVCDGKAFQKVSLANPYIENLK